MSSGSIRIIQLPEKSSVNTDDYMAVDSSANGTKKVKFTDLLDNNLSAQNKAADAQATGEAINDISARVDNMISTQTNASVTTLWTGSIDKKNQTATLSESIANFDFVDIYVSDVDTVFVRKPVSSSVHFEIQTQNMSDDASVQFLRWYETGLTISGTTATINKAIRCYWDDFSQHPVVAQAGSDGGANIIRIDGVKIGHVENDEIIDARVGADDVTYPTLGDAIRGQVTDLESDLETLYDTFTFIETPGYFSESGNIMPASSNEELYTNKVKVYPGETIFYEQILVSPHNMWGAYVVWDENNVRVQTRTIIFNALGNVQKGSIEIPKNGYQIAFCYRSYGETNSFKAFGTHDVVKDILSDYSFSTMDIKNQEFEYLIENKSSLSFSVQLDAGFYEIDGSEIQADNNCYCSFFRVTSGQPIYQASATSFKGGNKGYMFLPASTNRMHIHFTTSVASASIKIIKIERPWLSTAIAASLGETYNGSVDIIDAEQAQYTTAGKIASSTRICSGPYCLSGTFKISIADTTNYRFAIISLNNAEETKTVQDSGWITSEANFSTDNNACFGIVISKSDNSSISPSDMPSIGLSITSDAYWKRKADTEELNEVRSALEEVNADTIENNTKRSITSLFTGRFKPCYDHLFVNRTGNNIVIPHESLYHVRISKAFGYNTIEANVQQTSDGVYFVNHLAGGKFGDYFHHVDGITDISDITASSVTWDWIVQNVRYNSQIEKYRTRPCRLEEFLSECRQQNIIPFLGRTSDANVVAMADKYLGENNYIAYGANRTTCPYQIIYQWNVSLTTKADILNACNAVGKPFIYGMGNPQAFTDEELKDIVDTLHENGYWIGTSYADGMWYKYSAMGFDFNGTQRLVNRIETGNLYNFNSIFGFTDFSVTNATETNGVLTFTSQGTIRPNIDDRTYQLCMIDVELWFEGTITFAAIGEFGGGTYSSDGTTPVFFAVPIVNGSPKFTIAANNGTKINDIQYKASIC